MYIIPGKLNSKLDSLAEFVPPDMREESRTIVCQLAHLLGISNIVSMDTLNEPFGTLTQTENNKLVLIKHVVPIYLKTRDIRIIFLDSITNVMERRDIELMCTLFKNIQNKGVCMFMVANTDMRAGCTVTCQSPRFDKLNVET